MRNPGGYLLIAGAQTEEYDTFTCAHCNRVTVVPNRCSAEDAGGFCRCCMKLICGPCIDLPCVPFEKKLQEMEDRGRFHRQLQ